MTMLSKVIEYFGMSSVSYGFNNNFATVSTLNPEKTIFLLTLYRASYSTLSYAYLARLTYCVLWS